MECLHLLWPVVCCLCKGMELQYSRFSEVGKLAGKKRAVWAQSTEMVGREHPWERLSKKSKIRCLNNMGKNWDKNLPLDAKRKMYEFLKVKKEISFLRFLSLTFILFHSLLWYLVVFFCFFIFDSLFLHSSLIYPLSLYHSSLVLYQWGTGLQNDYWCSPWKWGWELCWRSDWGNQSLV